MSGLAQVTSPPYDVIEGAAATRFRDDDPHNVIRLTLPEAGTDGAPDAGYRAAGRTLREWISQGVLVPDATAGLYVYEERSEQGEARPARQRGLIGAVELSPPEAGIVLPHEDVTAAVVADRRQLMEATQANLEPIFLIYEGGGAASQQVDEVAETREPLIETVAGGATHRLWALAGSAEVAAVAADLAQRHAVIADGHHRYAAYLEIQAGRRASGLGAGPWDYGLALLVDSLAYQPRLDPIHRVIRGLPPEAATRLAGSAFSVAELPHGTGLADALRRLRDAPRGALAGHRSGHGPARGTGSRAAFLVGGDGRFRLLTNPDPARLGAVAPAGRSARWRSLDTAVLHELLIGEIWRIPGHRAVHMVHDDAAAAIQAAQPGGTAVICNPPRVADVLAIAAGGELMPRKSTSFGPKPRTGLVLRSFAYG